MVGGQWTGFRVMLSIVFVQDFYLRCLRIRVQIPIVGIVKQWRVLEGREHVGGGEGACGGRGGVGGNAVVSYGFVADILF